MGVLNFLNSPTLWGALIAAGVAVPILIHLLSRFRSKPLDWAAMELLRRAMVVRARHVRLEDLILLALRCLGIALIGLALARPALTPSGSSWFGGEGKAGVVIGLDGSFSMAHKPGVRSRFDLATDRTREILNTLSAGSPVTLAVLGNRPRVLLRNTPYDAERVEAVLKSLEPLDESLNLEVGMEDLNRLVREIRAPSRECYLVTDAQAISWEKVSETARRSMEKIREAGSLVLVPTGSGDSENLALTRFVMASGTLRRNSEARYVADVRNTGRAMRSNVSVQLLLNNAAVDQRVIESIAPGKTESVSLFCRFDKAGSFAVSARLGSDALPADNARFVVSGIRETVRILCVDGDPSDEPYHGETDYLAAALLPWGAEGDASLRVEKIRSIDLRITALSACDIVMLANVPEVIREHAAALGDFVRRGGGLMVFMGDKVNAELMNRRLADANGNPLLPAKLLEPVNAVADPARAGEKGAGDILASAIADHPLSRFLEGLPPEQRALITFERYFKVAPARDAAVLLKLARTGDPILLEHPYGRGRVVLFASTADRNWTDMPVHPAYLMLVQQAVTTLSGRSGDVPVMVSEPIVFDVPAEQEVSAVTVVNPRGVETSVRVTDRHGGKVAVLPAADLAGVYEARLGGAAAKAAANPDAAESDVTALEGADLRAAAGRLPVRLVREGESMVSVSRECRFGRELWPILLMMALAILAAEAILARLFVRRMRDESDEPARAGAADTGKG